MADRQRQHAFEKWRLRATVAWALVGAIVLFVLAVRGLGIVGQAVELLLVGVIVGFVCSPVTNWLEDRHVPRSLAALLALLLVVAAIVVVLALFVGPFLRELTVLLRNVPGYVTQLQDALATFWDTFGSSGSSNVQNTVNALVGVLTDAGTSIASDLARQLSTGLVANIAGLAGHLVTFFLGLILAYWFALDYPKIMRELAVIAGPDHDEDMVLTFAVLSRSMGGYMRGTLITSLANGVMVAAGLALLGHPYAGLLGIFTFVMHFIPVVGPFLSSVSSVLLGLFTSLPVAFWTLVITVVAQNVTDNVLSPIVMRSAVKIHPALSLLGIIIGGCLGGAVGMLFAVPLTAAIKGFFVYYFETHTGRQLVSREGAFFGSTPFADPDGRPQPTFDALDDDAFIERSRLLAGLARLHGEKDPGAGGPGTGSGEKDRGACGPDAGSGEKDPRPDAPAAEGSDDRTAGSSRPADSSSPEV
ncbi:AI-2E family transporter [Olsenella profusa]|uniref:AI-2E family transporter n=1 Tax=Olsenella profusa TaxID=138595 RepID=A0ABS2F2V2_9ACTN|nr:AI-2E family transporter [Olsenella profusa]MBM6775321.1 AI-2E family transporter [Olsenella profusa]